MKGYRFKWQRDFMQWWGKRFPRRIRCSFCEEKFWVPAGFKIAILGTFCSDRCHDRHLLDMAGMYKHDSNDSEE